MTMHSLLIRGALIGASVVLLAACDQDSPVPPTASVLLTVIPGTAGHGGAPLATTMTQEVTTAPQWAGDPDGTGTALVTINLGHAELCWQLTASDILLPATSAHIHRAAPGARGGVVLPLTAPSASGVAVGCAEGVSADLLQEILREPAAFYVNVHTTDYPAGAVRGQLGE